MSFIPRIKLISPTINNTGALLLLYTTQDQGFKGAVALLIKKTEQMLICSALIKRKEQVGSKGSNMMAFIGVATD